MSFFFQNKASPVPILNAKDPIDRLVEFVPTKAPYDPRWMIAGRPSQSECLVVVIIQEKMPIISFLVRISHFFHVLLNIFTFWLLTEHNKHFWDVNLKSGKL